MFVVFHVVQSYFDFVQGDVIQSEVGGIYFSIFKSESSIRLNISSLSIRKIGC